MKFGNLRKGWVFKLSLRNPNVITYRKTGRLRFLDILGILKMSWIVKKQCAGGGNAGHPNKTFSEKYGVINRDNQAAKGTKERYESLDNSIDAYRCTTCGLLC